MLFSLRIWRALNTRLYAPSQTKPPFILNNVFHCSSGEPKIMLDCSRFQTTQKSGELKMRKVTFGVAGSLDNYIARKDGTMDWILRGEEAASAMAEFWK